MRRYTAIFVSLAMLTVGLTATAGAVDSDTIENNLELRDRYDGQLDEMETTTHDFLVPSDSLYAFTIDWETGETSVDVIQQPLDFHEGAVDAQGCVSTGHADTPWAQPSVAVDDCSYTSISSSVSSTTVVCATDGDGCFADGLNFDFLNFGFFFVSCDSGVGGDVVDWGSDGGLLGATCEASQGGQSPLDWDAYDGICGSASGASAGAAGCVNQP